MKLTAILLLAVVATVAASRQRASSNLEKESLQKAKPFSSGHVYRFRYDSQISSGLGSMDTVNDQQKSTHRLSTMVNVHFETDRSATLQLEEVEIASLNGELPEIRRIQSRQLFNEQTIDPRKLEELQMSCNFEYSEGVIDRIYFNGKDAAWSKNIKRAVLNLLQLNLKERDNQQRDNAEERIEIQSTEVSYPKMFAVNETTVEGECETIYSIAKVSSTDDSLEVFNVTKAIDFKKCSKLPTIHYGRRTESPSYMTKRHELESQQLDRSTVLRYQLVGTLDKYAVANVELLSQYTVDAEENHAMQTVVASRLILQSIEKRTERLGDRSSNSKEESLLYSSEWDLMEKRFYQYGDEEYTDGSSPFRHVQNKVKSIVSMIQKVAASTNDKSNGIETETTLKLQKAVELLRMCDGKEIKQIASDLKQNEDELDIFMDVCAMAGTRNTIHYLVERIMKEDISSTKAVFLLRQLSSLPAISDKQIDMVLHLCKHDIVERSAPLRQACWLTVGSMIGDLCKQTVRDHEMCPRHKKETYEKALWSRFTSSEDLYERLVVLKAIGNAANDLSVMNLEKIIIDRAQSPMIRMHAIDALRRLRNEMPRKIQRILLPVFKNTLEVPEVRMTAFSMIMATFPEKAILDQISYTLHSERSNHVKSFVVRCYNALSTSIVPEERQMAPHLRTALTLANVDLDMSCHYHRIPLYFGQTQEGLFLNLASIVSTTDGIPKHLSASLDSLFNGLFEKDTVSFSFSQQNLEDLYHRFMEGWNQIGGGERRTLRAERLSRNGEQEIDSIFDDLKIKTREAFEQTPFGLINLRIRDIDQVVLPLGEEYMPRIVKAILKGEKLTTQSIPSILREGNSMRFATALSFQERSIKIATSAGMPLQILHSLPVIASFNGIVKAHVTSENVKITVNAQPLLSGVQTRKMEIWCHVVNTGVESLRSVELNLPIDMDLTVSHKNDEEKARITLRVPEQKTRLVGIHTLPLTFTRKYDAKLGLHGKTNVKTIHNTIMDSRLNELHHTETSITASGHFYYPKEMSLRSLNSMAWSNENHFNVEFDRKSGCADALEVVLSGKFFQNAETSSAKPRFEQFYQDNKKFQPVFDDDVEDYSNNDDDEERSDRRSRLNTYLSTEYKPRAAYRHFIKAVAKTVGGKFNHEVSANVQATCDSHMAFCRFNTELRRTPMFRGEKSEWTLKAESQLLLPEHVREISELNDKKSSRQHRLAVTLDAEWGCQEQKAQKLNVQLQGERAVPQQWIQQRSSGEEWRRILATAFINKYDLVAEYKLSPRMQTRLQHYFELLKYWNFWNSDSSDSIEGTSNTIKATVIIDPRTRQHFNVSVQTPSERTRFTNVQLPMTVKPFPLIRPQEQRYEISSVEDMVTEYSDSRRAECRVDGRRIKTFDSVTYKAPIGRCYSIIAKDCAKKSFVVLMKTIDEETEAKNVKIVTARNTVEVELVDEKLVVKVNGERITDEDRLREYNIDYSEDLVRVMLPEGVSVRFDGKQATVKLSNYYKNAQCGLCGEFNGEQDDEFRMNDNSLTDDVKDFHRSYSMINDDCKNIYTKNTLFGSPSSSRRQQEDSDEFENEDMNEEVEEYDMFDRRNQETRPENDDEDEDKEPIKKTKIVEFNHKICFSLKPIKECPRGLTMQNYEEVKIPYTCRNRSSTEARRLLREAKSGDITHKLSAFKDSKPSFVETLRSARVCA